MRDYCRYVNVFQGSGAVELPKPEGVAAAWRFIKGLCGNTTPAAALPFGKMTCCSYSGGYSSGYGNLKDNYGEPLQRLFEGDRILGFSHLHGSGTGFTGTFYNYAVTTPFYGGLENARILNHMVNETARPGYYATEIQETGILGEVTVTRATACHRYTFRHANGRISIDLSNDGLRMENPSTHAKPAGCNITVTAAGDVEAMVNLHGLPLYIFVRRPQEASSVRIWQDDRELDSLRFMESSCRQPFGCVFEIPNSGVVNLQIAISALSMEKARSDVYTQAKGFDEVREEAYHAWNERLSAISVETEDERQLEIFYSNFYHTLVKPSDWSGENFIDPQEDTLLLDFATLWDQYKTQMPLLFTLYPDIAEKVMQTFRTYACTLGHMPHMLLLNGDYAMRDDDQAKMLAAHTVVDAFYRNVPADYLELLRLIVYDLEISEDMQEYQQDGICSKVAQTIDMADGCHAAAEMAQKLGCEETACKLKELAGYWIHAFDKETGLLKADSQFYEGSHWNYSFRLMHDMTRRIAFAGSKEQYAALLDRFFGFTCAEDISARFEGFNNQTDMETPYAYYYADRHDRLCEVLDGEQRYLFTDGRGGLPGNNDSGGLSSCYIWNAIGIFPVSGQNLMLIGSPNMPEIRVALANGNTFVIQRSGSGIYVERAELNGKPLPALSFSVDELMRGGNLKLFMKEEIAR